MDGDLYVRASTDCHARSYRSYCTAGFKAMPSSLVARSTKCGQSRTSRASKTISALPSATTSFACCGIVIVRTHSNIWVCLLDRLCECNVVPRLNSNLLRCLFPPELISTKSTPSFINSRLSRIVYLTPHRSHFPSTPFSGPSAYSVALSRTKSGRSPHAAQTALATRSIKRVQFSNDCPP